MVDKPTQRRLGVGSSRLLDPVAAATEATASALVDDPKLAVVFCSPQLDPTQVLPAVLDRSGGAPLIGCTTAGEIDQDGPASGSVVVTMIGGPGFEVSTRAETSIRGDPRAAGARLGDSIDSLNGMPSKAAMVLADGLAPQKQDLINGIYSRTGAGIPIVGGGAGGGPEVSRTLQFHGDAVLEDGAVIASIASTGSIGIGIEHGFSPIAGPAVVTRASGARILELDRRPALDAYREAHGLKGSPAKSDQVGLAFIRDRPLALSTPRGRAHLRFIGGLDGEQGALVCLSEVPSGSLVWFMRGTEDTARQAGAVAAREALTELQGPPIGLVCFDCVVRRRVLGEQGMAATVRTIKTDGGSAPIAGFHGYGQIGRTRGLSGLHNLSLVVLALG